MPLRTLSGVNRLSRPSWSSGPQSPQVEPGGRRFQRGLSAISDLHELLQAAQPGRKRLAFVAIAPIRERYLADIDITAGIDRQTVRRDELARLETGRAVAEPRQEFALGGIDADARPDIGHVVIDPHAAADLADVEARVAPTLHVKAGRAVHVVPLPLVFAVAVEHLDAVVLAVGDIDPAIRVTADVVRDVELAGIGAGFAPRHQELAVRRVFVDAGIAIAVGDIDLLPRR